MKLSVKTRIGMEADEEFERLLAIYNQYPISELIIHPRLQQDYYKNHPRKEAYRYALERAKRLYATTATYLRKGRSGSLRPNFRRKIA